MFLNILLLLQLFCANYIMAHGDNYQCCNQTDIPLYVCHQDNEPEIFSWHVHVLFNASTELDFAQDFHDKFITDYNITDCDEIYEGILIYDRICSLDFNKHNPPENSSLLFPSAMFSFFIPKELYNDDMINWWKTNGNNLSIMFHPQTGCQVYDHSIWPVWINQEQYINTISLPCNCQRYQPDRGIGEGVSNCYRMIV